MFCTNCGSNLSNDTLFCNNCGTKVVGQQQQATMNTGTVPFAVNQGSTYGGVQYPQKRGKNKWMIPAIVGATVAIIILLWVVLMATPGYSKPVKYMVKGMQKGNYSVMLKAYPSFMRDEMEEQILGYSDDAKEAMKKMHGILVAGYGKDFSISYKVMDKEKIDSSEVEDLEENINYRYDKDVDIEAAYELEVKLTIKGELNRNSTTTTITVFKMGSKWYTIDNIY